METLTTVANTLSGYVWAWPSEAPLLVLLLLGVGLVTTLYMGAIQVRKLAHGFAVVRGKYDNPDDEGDITHFQALTTALSATVGIGNIAGVATAIHYGGPGALFWMWVTAVFGMALKFVECTLAMEYRTILPNGEASGGPMYYIEKGLGPAWKPLAVFFAGCAILASFGSGNAVQAFTIADQMRADLGIATWLTGAITVAIVGAVILGGIRRIGAVTSKLAPIMALIYVAGGLFVLLTHAAAIPGIFGTIIESAFQPAAKLGGFAGGSFIFMLTWGVKRGLFSNESGQGSAPIAHAAAKTDEPVREGVVAMLGPFIDTLLICTITGLVILSTNVWSDRKDDILDIGAQAGLTVLQSGAEIDLNGVLRDADRFNGTLEVVAGTPRGAAFVRNHSLVSNARITLDGADYSGAITIDDGNIDFGGLPALELRGGMAQNGSVLTAWGFQRGLAPLGNWGHYIVTLSVLLFGVSTAISWSYYGDRATTYLFGSGMVVPYKIMFLIMHFLGAIVPLEFVWGFGDVALGLMTIPNLIAIVLLLPTVNRLTKDYFSRTHTPYK